MDYKVEKMKKILLLLPMIYGCFALAQEPEGTVIELEIININSDYGKMMIGLYDSKGNWLNIPFKGAFGQILDGKSKATFSNIPAGTYAISVFHDDDDDGELNTFLGIPTEDTGSSNDAPARFGPPKWEAAKFIVEGKPIKQTIKL